MNYCEDVQKFLSHDFDFDNQTKTSYGDCVDALNEAIVKRSVGKVFTGLSSGYDSAVLCHHLILADADFKCYTIPANENMRIIEAREQIFPVNMIEIKNYKDIQATLRHHCGDYYYEIEYNPPRKPQNWIDDFAAVGTYYIAMLAKSEGYNVYLSTQGADEIISDYSLIPEQSFYKGVFPEKLVEWPNFKRSCQISYIKKEAMVAKASGIEAKYPFLDVDFVQEYLWLTPELKNRNYKSVLYEYLKFYDIPFEPNVKRGFNV